MSENGSVADQLDSALDTIRSAYARAAAIIKSTADPAAAFRDAGRLADVVREATGATGQLRADMAARIWQSEEMSLAGLASRIGVSKARAAQFINAAKTREGDHDG